MSSDFLQQGEPGEKNQQDLKILKYPSKTETLVEQLVALSGS